MSEPISVQVEDNDLLLLTDLYQLTMVQAYWRESMQERATFSLFFRKLPHSRRFMLACGQQYAAALVSQLRCSQTNLDRLADTGKFDEDFLDWLGNFSFSGDIWTLPEGTPVFQNEPFLEVDAPIAEAQLLESLIMNLVQPETVLASKAVRIAMAAEDRPVVDFGMRRMHGVDAAMRGVRAYRTAGIAATSNVLGGLRHDLTLNGTMAHSYILAHDDEREAFRTFARQYPETVLLVDTHDTLKGVQMVIDLMNEESDLKVSGVRLDSGDLGELAHRSRAMLDEAGYPAVKIIASSGLDEHKIQALLKDRAPIDAFGVGTQMAVAADAPVIDLSYKLVEYAERPRVKHASGKINLPGRKQVYRRRDARGRYVGDIIACRDEKRADGEALLVALVKNGRLDDEAMALASNAREWVQAALKDMPDAMKELEEGETDYPVELSDELSRLVKALS